MSVREKQTQIISTTEDEEFTIWLSERFSGDEYASRISVHQWINNQRGDCVFTHDVKPDASDGKSKVKGKPKLTREKLVELTHKIKASAQADCDALRRSTVYSVMAWHSLMGSDAYSRHLLRLSPKSALAVDVGAVVGEDNIMSTKLLVGLLANSERNARWAIESALNLATGAADRLDARTARLETLLDGRIEKETRYLEAIEEARDRSAERKVKLDWAELKVSGAKTLVSSLTGLLSGGAAMITAGKVGVEQSVKELLLSMTRGQIAALVGGSLESPSGGILSIPQATILRRIDAGETALLGALFSSLTAQQLDQMKKLMNQTQLLLVRQVMAGIELGTKSKGANTSSETETETAAETVSEMSPEAVIIDRFFAAVKADPNANAIDMALFGSWEKAEDGTYVSVKPGALTDDQFKLIVGVRRGELRAEALDELLPGGKLALTEQQQTQVTAILPMGIALILGELVALRTQARANAAAQN